MAVSGESPLTRTDDKQLDTALEIFDELDADGSKQIDREDPEFKLVLAVLQENEWVAETNPGDGRQYWRNRLTNESKSELPTCTCTCSGDEAVEKFIDRTFAALSGGSDSERPVDTSRGRPARPRSSLQ